MNRESVENAADVIRLEREGLQRLESALADAESPLAAATSAGLDLMAAATGRLIVTGMGKSGHIARKIAATFASTGTPALYVHPGEASHGDLGMIGDGDAVLALSNSGETRELGDIVAYCKRFAIPLVAITGDAASSLAASAAVSLVLPAAREACPEIGAPTTSTTMALALGDALAVALLRRRGFSREEFSLFHPGGRLGAQLRRVRDLMHTDREIPLVRDTDRMDRAVSAVNEGGFGCVGAIDAAGRLVGVITDGDLRRRLGAGLLEKSVGEVMTRAPKSVSPETLAADALRILSATKITALFVVEDAKPVGLLHVHDVLDVGVM